MQAIHLLKQLGIRPRAHGPFVAWMDEEQGAEAARPTPQRCSAPICKTMSVRWRSRI